MSTQATVFYPNNTLQIPLNVKDSVDVTYNTPWPSTNLTLLCRAATSSLYDFYNIPDNPLSSSGHYLTPSIENMNLNVHNFPADCRFRLTQFGNNALNADSAAFVLTSVEAAPRTFAIGSTVGLSTTIGSSSMSASPLSTPISTSVLTATGSQSVSVTASSSSAHSSDFNRATSVGIGVGVGVGVAIIILIAAIIAYVVYRRKSRQRNKPSTIVCDDRHYNEKPELPGIDPERSSYRSDMLTKVPNVISIEKDGRPFLAEAEGSDVYLPSHPSKYELRNGRYELQG